MAQPLLAPPPGPFLDEEDMPESTLHDQAIVLLQAILLAWARRAGFDALVARNLACRWVPSDARIGVDPDLMLITPAPPFPPGKRSLKQLRLWEPGHSPPRVTFEVVSEFTSDKDYLDAPWAHGAAGTGELWVFDPELHGTGKTGGPFRLQVWRRQTDGTMKREHAGSGPCWSHELQAWLVVTDAGTRLRLSDDRTGTQLWLTDAEAQTLAHQTERKAREAAEAAQQAAETAQVEQTSRAHEAEAARQQAEAARQQAEAEREREREARSRAEAELEELKRRLASLESRPPRG
jgi:Uma2 family endonuclease